MDDTDTMKGEAKLKDKTIIITRKRTKCYYMRERQSKRGRRRDSETQKKTLRNLKNMTAHNYKTTLIKIQA